MIGLRRRLPTSLFELRRDKTTQQEGKVNRAVARQSEGGLGYVATWRDIARQSGGGFRFDTLQLAAGSFIFTQR